MPAQRVSSAHGCGLREAALALALSVAAAGCRQASLPPSAPPRVLLVTLDTTRADRLGCYGYARGSTPVLDRLAAQGVRFASALAPTPITLPSHATLLSGVYPVRHGVRNNGTYRLGPELPTLAERFAGAGYGTAAIVASAMLDSRFGLARGFEHYDDDLPVTRQGEHLIAERPAGEVTRRALAWAGSRKGSRWFLWVHYFDPHAEYAPPEPFASRFRDRPYDGEIAYVDEALGELLEGLAGQGLLEDTLVAVTADHGESLGEHGERTHGIFIYSATLRVPLLLHWGAGLPGGRVVGEIAGLADVAPTLLDLSGLPPLPQAQGRSLAGALRGGETVRRDILLESWLPRLNYGWSELVGIADGRWKYIRAPRSELYNLEEDPGELDNRAARDPGVAAQYRDRLERALEESSAGGNAEAAAPARPDPETERLLRGLGYLGAGAVAGARSPGAAGGGLPDPKDKIGEFAQISEALPLIARGRVQEAVNLLERAERSNPGSPLVRRHLGNAYRLQGRLERAEDRLRSALRLNPEDPGALVDLALTLVEQVPAAGAPGPLGRAGRGSRGGFDEAESLLREALSLNPDLATARHVLGAVHERRGRPAQAETEYRAALALDPHLTQSLGNLALLLEARGEWEGALALYRRGSEIDPANARWRTSAAWVLSRQGRLEEAADELRRAAELDRSSPGPLLSLAQVLEQAGDQAGAVEALRRAVEREERIGGTTLEMARYLLRRGEACAAAAALEPLLQAGEPLLRNQARAEHRRALDRCASLGGRAPGPGQR